MHAAMASAAKYVNAEKNRLSRSSDQKRLNCDVRLGRHTMPSQPLSPGCRETTTRKKKTWDGMEVSTIKPHPLSTTPCHAVERVYPSHWTCFCGASYTDRLLQACMAARPRAILDSRAVMLDKSIRGIADVASPSRFLLQIRVLCPAKTPHSRQLGYNEGDLFVTRRKSSPSVG